MHKRRNAPESAREGATKVQRLVAPRDGAARLIRDSITPAAVALLIGAAGCVKATAFGPCIGLNQTPRADRTYAWSARNIALGIVGFELVYPPVKVLLDEAKCPVGVAGAR